MTDSKNGSELISVKKHDGTELHLPKLSPSEFIMLADQLKTRRKGELEHNLAFSSVTGKDALETLNAFDAREVNRADVLGFILTDRGQQQTILLALRHIVPDATEADVDGLEFPAGGLMRTAGRVAHLRMDTSEGGKSENPLAEPGAGDSSADSGVT